MSSRINSLLNLNSGRLSKLHLLLLSGQQNHTDSSWGRTLYLLLLNLKNGLSEIASFHVWDILKSCSALTKSTGEHRLLCTRACGKVPFRRPGHGRGEGCGSQKSPERLARRWLESEPRAEACRPALSGALCVWQGCSGILERRDSKH